MRRKSIAVIGPGRLGTILAEQLAGAGYSVVEIIARENAKSLSRARQVARRLKARASDIRRAQFNSDVVWFCVPDASIADVATQLAARDWEGKTALHSSGALGSDALDVLRRRGASVASAHPLMTFVHGSKPSLSGVPFAVEGDRIARRVAGQIVRALGGEVFGIRKQDKAAYHAFATFVCPLLVSLLASSEKIGELAGISRSTARRRMLPIVRQTLANYEQMGPAGAFSGPIVRGDVETIAQHLAVMDEIPSAKAAYSALAAAAVEFLPAKNRLEVLSLLTQGARTTPRNVQGIGRDRKRQAPRH